MQKKILLPIASAVLASTLVFTTPVLAEEVTAPTTINEILNQEVTTSSEETVTEEVTQSEPVEITVETTDEVAEQASDNTTNDLEVTTDEALEVTTEVSTDGAVAPDSFLYTFKLFFEEVRLFFTFEDAKKAELLAQLANERLLEADLAAESGNIELVKELITAYEEKIAALEALNQDSESVTGENYDLNDSVIEEIYGSQDNDSQGEDTASVTEETYEAEDGSGESETTEEVIDKYKLKNIAALTMVCNKVPDHVKPIIQRNLQRAIEKREAHLAKKQLKYKKKAVSPVGEDVATVETVKEATVDKEVIKEISAKDAKKADKKAKKEAAKEGKKQYKAEKELKSREKKESNKDKYVLENEEKDTEDDREDDRDKDVDDDDSQKGKGKGKYKEDRGKQGRNQD